MIPFSTYSGAGNTFHLFDNRNDLLPEEHFNQIPIFCRSTCTKVDGLISIEHSQIADVRMRIFNLDGSEAEMCGNGLRALIAYLKELGDQREKINVEVGTASRKVLQGWMVGNDVKVSLNYPKVFGWNIPFEKNGAEWKGNFLNTGVPHAVFFLSSNQELEMLNIRKVAPYFRHHPTFSPAGANVDFAYFEHPSFLKLRTFERGVEGETQACGTGATAAALCALYLYRAKPPVTVEVKSGLKLIVDFDLINNNLKTIWLQGPAEKIDSGLFKIRPF